MLDEHDGVASLRERVVILAGIGVVALLVKADAVPPCWAWTLGAPCPGCGTTRALIAACRFNFAEAFHLNPAWPLGGLFALGLVDAFLGRALGRRRCIDSEILQGFFNAPRWIQLTACLLLEAYNLSTKGLNVDGWLVPFA